MAQASVAITQFWNAEAYQWQTTPPTVPTGSELGFVARITNTSGATENLTLYMVMWNPDGTKCFDYTYAYAGSAPGFYADANISHSGNQVGVYKGDAYAYVGSTLVASAVGVTIATTTGALSAKINDWNYWDPSANNWSPTYPSTVIQNQQIGVQVYAVNMGSTPITVHLDLTIHEPDGAQSTLSGSPVALEDGGTTNPSAWTHWDLLWTGSKVGDYTVDMTLYGPSGVLDTRTGIQVASVQAPGPTPSGHIMALALHDVTVNKEYDPTTWPVQIDLNHTVWAGAEFFNDSTVPLTVGLSIWFDDPSGSQRGLYSETDTIPVGGSKTLVTPNLTLDKQGYWYLHAKLGTITTSVWDAIAVQAPLPEYAQLSVSITDSSTKKPLAGVAEALNSAYTGTSGTDGTYSFINIPVGTYTVKCTKTGYQDYTQSVTLGQGNNALSIAMVAIGMACSVDSDCPTGYVCRNGVCVAETWWDKFVAWSKEYWWAYAAGGGTIILAAALTRKKKTT